MAHRNKHRDDQFVQVGKPINQTSELSQWALHSLHSLKKEKKNNKPLLYNLPQCSEAYTVRAVYFSQFPQTVPGKQINIIIIFNPASGYFRSLTVVKSG